MLIPLAANAGIPARYANRHALITGPTGTGKTVTLQTLIEGFSAAGVPVFAADVKGDLSALARSCPHQFLDVYGQTGAPLRVPVLAFGADLLGRALELSDVQAGCLEIGFAYAKAHGLRLATLSDLRALLARMIEERESISSEFGQIGAASIGVVQRALLRLEAQGAAQFFGAPGFDIARLMPTSGKALQRDGAEVFTAGLVSLLDAEKLLHAPRLYSALMLWLLRELFQRLPEVGDMPAPRLILVFDEAHTIFADCPAPLLRSIEQTARLIRSKGVGLYFASQSPGDVPELIASQLATRVEHSRALGVGKAIFSTLDARGMPTAPRLIAPALPSCPLGAYDGPRAGSTPAASAPAAISDPARLNWQGWLVLGLFGALALALIVGAVALFQTGQLIPAIALVIFGIWFLKPRRA